MDASTFVTLFPEFADSSPKLIQAKLNAASALMGGPDQSVWGSFAATGQQPTIADLAQGNRAAHLLYVSPMGTETRLVEGGRTSYLDEFERLEAAVCGGFLVAGASLGVPSTVVPTQGLVLNPGSGFAGVTNGSMAVTFSTAQTLPAGTIIVFLSQPGAYYSLAFNVLGANSGTLTAPYTGPTNAATTWNHS